MSFIYPHHLTKIKTRTYATKHSTTTKNIKSKIGKKVPTAVFNTILFNFKCYKVNFLHLSVGEQIITNKRPNFKLFRFYGAKNFLKFKKKNILNL